MVTEGILTRQLQGDPALEGVGCVIFDEYHERSLQADLGLALVLDAQRHLRPELRILVMSATLDTEAVARLLGTDVVISAAGLQLPGRHALPAAPVRRSSSTARPPPPCCARCSEEPGDVLVFLPGAGEIRRVERALQAQSPAGRGQPCCPCSATSRRDEQDRAIRPGGVGERKVVLATNIAETSLTIEGVRVVIDCGLERRSRLRSGERHEPAGHRAHLARLRRPAPRPRRDASGPACATGCGPRPQQRALAAQAPAEILEADLAPLALELAAWGARPGALSWLDPPPAATLAQAADLLRALGALDAGGRITPHGRDMAALGAHPRLAHLLLRAREAGVAATGCALAALLSERDMLRGRERDADMRTRLELLRDIGCGGIQRDGSACGAVLSPSAAACAMTGASSTPRRPAGCWPAPTRTGSGAGASRAPGATSSPA